MLRRVGFVFAFLLFCAATLAIAYFAFVSGYVMRHPSFEQFPVQGVDLSHHQGDVDWQALAADRRGAFAYIKATEGGDFNDSNFAQNWRDAKKFGVARVDQAQNFVRAMGQDFGELPPALDLEYLGNCAKRPTREDVMREINAFVNELKQHDPRKPMFYVSNDFYETYVQGLEAQFPEHDDWVRNLLLEPSPPSWVFWQFAQTGRVGGIAGPVDLNVFNGSKEEFAKRFGVPKS
jgi:lysozyme